MVWASRCCSCTPWGWFLPAVAGAVLGVLAAAGRGGRLALASLAAVVGLAGCLYGGLHSRLAPGPLAAYEDRVITLEAMVARDPEPHGRQLAVVARATAVLGEGGRTPTGGLVRFQTEFTPLAPGDRLVVRGILRRPARAGNPGELDSRRYHAARGVHWFLYPRGGFLAFEPGGPSFARWLAGLRERLRKGLGTLFTPPIAAFYRTVILGDPSAGEVPAESFRRAGVAHLLAVSGLHVGFAAAGAATLARHLRLGPVGANLMVTLVTVLYVLLAGARSSAVRAGLMAIAATWAVPLGRRHNALAAVGLAALVIVLATPAAVDDPGFQLSFAATLGLVALTGPLRESLPRRLPGRRLVAPATAAQLAVFPLLLYHYGEVAPLALLANVALVPVAGLVIPIGAVGGLIGDLLGRPLLIASAPAGVLLDGVSFCAGLPPGPVRLPPPPIALLAGYYLGLAGLAAGRRRLGVLVMTILLIWWGALAAPVNRLEVTFIDVGQGDAILIRTPAGVTALVDGGGVSRGAIQAGARDPGERVTALLRREGVRRVDCLLLTHPHTDHAGGLVAVVGAFPVGLLLEGGPAPDAAEEYLDLLAAVAEAGIPRRLVGAGDRISLGRGRSGEVILEYLWPGPADLGRPANDRSVVLVLRYGQTALLLTGDAGIEVERALLAAGVDLQAGLLKVGHHGSEGGTSREFLAAVGAVHAVISCGKYNPFGHPSPGVLARLEEAGAAVWRTDSHGAVRVASDGRRMTIRATLAPETRAVGARPGLGCR
ncbi:MAG: ComEC/Rec2 family competence protein [bacterium]|nr:ComEC/Rec2 family competence protein [bacterium]